MPCRAAIETALNLCLAREREERRLAATASDAVAYDTHFMRAERFADQAWAIAEDHDIPFIPSAIWARCGGRQPSMSAARGCDPAPIAV